MGFNIFVGDISSMLTVVPELIALVVDPKGCHQNDPGSHVVPWCRGAGQNPIYFNYFTCFTSLLDPFRPSWGLFLFIHFQKKRKVYRYFHGESVEKLYFISY